MNTRDLGKIGEAFAAEYLENKGYRILGRNVYVSHCEIDVLAESDTHILFTEVKTRREFPDHTDRYGRPGTAVNAVKKASLIKGASLWISRNREILGNRQPRIDVVEVYLSPLDGALLSVRHIENAVRRT